MSVRRFPSRYPAEKSYQAVKALICPGGLLEALTLVTKQCYDSRPDPKISPILIDERLGRRVAQRHGLTVVGSLAVALQAKQLGLVSAVLPLIQRLEQHGYYLSKPLKQAVLAKAEEL